MCVCVQCKCVRRWRSSPGTGLAKLPCWKEIKPTITHTPTILPPSGHHHCKPLHHARHRGNIPLPPPPSLVHRRHQTRGQHGFLASLGSFLQTTPSADEKEIWTRRHSATLPWLRRRLPGWTLEGIRSPLTNCTHTGCGPSVAAALCGPLGHDMIASQPPGRVPTVRHSCSMAVRVIGVTTHVCTGPVEWCSVAQTRQARPSCWPAGSRTRARPWCVTTVYHQPPSGLCRCS